MEIRRGDIYNKTVGSVDNGVKSLVGGSQRSLDSVTMTVVELQPFHNADCARERYPVLDGFKIVGHVSI